MNRTSLAGHPALLGFDRLEALLERAAKSADGYPPFNIERRSENVYRITLAVAGFAEGDLSVTVEDRQLVLRGRRRADGEAREFLHKGIGTRQFQRSFVLADGIEVSGAMLENGLLHVDLERAVPETVVTAIPIATGRNAPKKEGA
ncbi:HSP20 family molecular chaperone IbpA [Hasllibacter halocynthiae]|uniref:HSP20 family molecular chaperone IbpA n=1 Tax=Hasllibacter halocynthiae TaxID=595589 RepID=A0A2T0X0W6_9RHOB|nr:Hsp20 family protein [Hasllibacter halocynthiae]PRY92588.1 HSP20 family molecular chaperone IbpA [Hasllibacter halocynthiae]